MSQYNKRGFIFCFLVCCFLGVYAQTPALLKGDNTYEEGIELFRKEQFGNAQQKFDAFLDQNQLSAGSELNTSAEYYAALCAIKLYNKDARNRVIDFGKRNELSPLKNTLYFEYANYRFSTKRYKEANEYYEKVDQFRIGTAQLNELTFKNAYSLLMKEESDKAKDLFFQLKDKDSKYANSARYYYSHLLYVDSNYAEALTNFLPLEGDKSFGPFIPYYLAQIYYGLKDYDKLVEVGEDLIERATEKRAPEIAKLLADAFYKRNDYENAIKYLEIYKAKGGKMLLADHFQLGYSYYQLERYQIAIESFNKISRGKKDLRQNAYYHLGDCYLRVGQKKQAITAFKAASEIGASEEIREDAFFNYAKLVYEQSDPYKDAISTLNEFLKEFPGTVHKVEINRYLANLYLTTKDYDRALLALKKVGLESPEMKEIYQKISFYRATEIFNSLRYVEAISKYKESLKYPVNIRVAALSKFWMGECYYRLKKYDDALETMNEFRKMPGVINLDEYSQSYYQSAYCYYKQFDFQRAASSYRTFTRDAEKDDPRLSDAYMRMADCHFLTAGYIKASEFYAQALKLKTKEADYAYFQRAECLGLIGKRESKIKELEKLVKKFPQSDYAEESEFEIAETHLRLENYPKALSAYQTYLNKYPKSNNVVTAKMQIGLIYSNTEKNEKAIETFKGVVADYPGTDQSIEAVRLARLVYARLNRINDYIDWVDGLNFVNFEKSTLDSTAYEVAFDLYSEGKCEEAITAFTNYLKRFDKGLFVLKSNYYNAQCARRVGDENLELASYENISLLPRNEYSAQAYLKLAKHALLIENYPLALERFEKLEDLPGDNAQKLNAAKGVMGAAFKLGDYEKAANYGEKVNTLNSDDAILRIETQDIITSSYYKLENFAKALVAARKLTQISEGESKAKGLYYMADILHQNGELDSSETVVYQLIEELPAFKEYKMRALILLAKNFWKKEDIFQANYTLDFVINSDFSEEISKEAQLLKEEIKQDEEQKALEKARQLKEQTDSVYLDEGDGELLLFEVSDDLEDIEELNEEPVDTNNRKN